MHLPLDTSELSLYPYLFAVCRGGTSETWSGEGVVSGREKNMFLSPLGRFGIRSGAMKFVILSDMYYFR